MANLIELILKSKRYAKEYWENKNPILFEGELGFESDTPNFKIGDGVTAWNNLDYVTSEYASKLSGNRKIGNAVFDNTKDLTLEEIGVLSTLNSTLSGTLNLGEGEEYYIDGSTGKGSQCCQ